MLLPIKPICPASKARKDGTSIIFLQYCKSEDDKTLLNTEIGIPPRYWNKKLKRVTDDLPSSYGDFEKINLEVHRMYRIAEDIIKFAISNKHSDPVQFVKNTFSPNYDTTKLEVEKLKLPEKEVNLDFFYQFDEYLKSKVGTVTDGTMDVFKNLKSILLKFQEYRKNNIGFEQIDLNFYEEYVHYLKFEHIHFRRKKTIKGLKLNSVGKNVKQLIIFLKNRRAKRIISELDLTGFKIAEEEADAIYLTPEEINKILLLDLTQTPGLKKYRDVFVFGCLTGLRYSDFSKLKSEDVRDGMLFKKQGKSKHRVVIPLRDEANYIFEHIFNRNIPETSNAEFNLYIKEIGKLAGLTQTIKHSYIKENKEIVITKPKYAWITSHTCRRSFCTNEFLAGTPVELIMKISGHKSLKDFYKYIKITPEQAGLRIKEIWQKRGEINKALDVFQTE